MQDGPLWQWYCDITTNLSKQGDASCPGYCCDVCCRQAKYTLLFMSNLRKFERSNLAPLWLPVGLVLRLVLREGEDDQQMISHCSAGCHGADRLVNVGALPRHLSLGISVAGGSIMINNNQRVPTARIWHVALTSFPTKRQSQL